MGTLYVVATPIGNLEDLTPRAARILREVATIAAEDTRHSRRLLAHAGISTPLVSYHEHNQREREALLLRLLGEGDVALISDAGTPAVSDPGAEIVAAALAAGHRVSPVPGPSSLTAAVSVSGIVDGPFVFLGFLPRGGVERSRVISRAGATAMPIVLFEAANRLAATVADLERALGDRQAVIARELTKVHEEIRRGSLTDLRSWAIDAPPRGEVVLVVGSGAPRLPDGSDAEAVIAMLRRSGLRPSQAAREAAGMTGLPRSELYRMATAVDLAPSVGLEGELPLANEDALEDPLHGEERPQRRKARADKG